MAMKELKKATKTSLFDLEKDVENFITQSTILPEVAAQEVEQDDDHRLTLRIPKSLMAKIDVKRKQRIGKISRNLWILETLDRATKR